MKLFCPALLSGKYFPARCTAPGMPGGMSVSPPITWTDVPPNTRSFILSIVAQLPDARHTVHWAVVNIPARTREIPEKASGNRDRMPAGCQELRNSFGGTGYVGPNEVPGSGTHEYTISVIALSEESFEFGQLAMLPDVLGAVGNSNIATATVTGILRL